VTVPARRSKASAPVFSSHCLSPNFRIAGVDDTVADRQIADTPNLHKRVVCRSPRRDMSQEIKKAAP
jgi:hypothetical protein